MRIFIRYTLVIFAIFIVLASIAAVFSSGSSKTTDISLSTLVQQINAGEVKSIETRGIVITATLQDEKTKETTNIEPGAAPSNSLKNLGVIDAQWAKIDYTIKSESGLASFVTNILFPVLPFVLVIGIFWLMFRQAQRGAATTFNFGKSKARLAGTDGDTRKKVKFKDVAGLAEAKEEIGEVVEFLRDPRKFQKLGAHMPRGVLLIGTPGTGKTLLARAVANEASVPFHFVSGSEFVEMFVGIGATRVRDTFDAAKKTAPSIIFIDEIDAVGRHRGAGLGGGHDEREQTLNQILVEMDGFDTNDAVVVIAATNRPDILDPALLRPGRFDRRIVLDEPSLADREEILKIHALDKPLDKDINLRVVAERTVGFSGADLANLINEAAILAARTDQSVITQLNMLQAIEKVLLGPERKSHIFTKKEKEIAAYHEAGHSLVAISLPYTDPIHKVSIVSRGRAGGYTLKLPSEDRHLRSRSEFESELAVLMGGYVAEQVIFDELTTGASSDLRISSDLARKMVTEYGMSAKLGPIVFGEKDELVFLGKDIATQRNYSEEIASQIDSEVKALITKALSRARAVIEEKHDILQRIAQELVAKETLEQKDFYALVGMPVPASSSV